MAEISPEMHFFGIISAKSFFVPKIITIFAIDLIAKTNNNFKY